LKAAPVELHRWRVIDCELVGVHAAGLVESQSPSAFTELQTSPKAFDQTIDLMGLMFRWDRFGFLALGRLVMVGKQLICTLPALTKMAVMSISDSNARFSPPRVRCVGIDVLWGNPYRVRKHTPFPGYHATLIVGNRKRMDHFQ
jgi:hypothetical protein